MAAISLGDVRAEHDRSMLREAFFESADYKTLIESDIKSIVVGRRGVGKSALFIRLGEYYEANERTDVIRIAPDEHEVLALRAITQLFDGQFGLIRAATRLGFRFALLMEIALGLSTKFKFNQAAQAPVLLKRLQAWRTPGTVIDKLRHILIKATANESNVEARVGAIADDLKLNELESCLNDVLESMKRKVVVLIDKLDEGYKPDEAGIGIVDGFIQASVDLHDHSPYCRAIVFLRDNIYRAVAQKDQDFSRNLEQAVLRIHWDERSLQNVMANRIKKATGIKVEKTIKVWDSVTQGTLQGESGFHTCLRLTLYRPRDLLLLLNDAFRNAAASDRYAIEQADINASANV